MIEFGTRGIMANPEAGLMLKFQFNPSVVDFSKKPEYELQTPAGWSRPIVWYLRNGEKHIEFDLVGDATAGTMGRDAKILRPFGVRDQISTLESFMLPETSAFAITDSKSQQFIEPPDCYFVFGMQWAKTKVLEAPIKQMLFDRDMLNPQRFTTRIKLLVIEDSMSSAYNSAARMVMSKLGSVVSALSINGVGGG